jgi:hypothetical protein
MREDRLVFPIPPGTHWRDVQAVVLPGDAPVSPPEQRPALPGATKRDPRKSKKASPAPMPMGGFRFVSEGQPERAKAAKTKRQPKPKVKIDPKFVAAARELRDRYLEQMNTSPLLSQGKYDVSRTLSEVEGSRALGAQPIRSLPAA